MSSYYFNDHDQGPPPTPANARTCSDGATWVCEHRRAAIANMVGFRNAAGAQNISDVVVHRPNTVSFQRAGRAFIIINRDSAAWTVTKMPTGLPAGLYCNVIVSDEAHACPWLVVDLYGIVRGLVVEPLSAVALHVHATAGNSTVAPTHAPTNATKVPTATHVPTTHAPTNSSDTPTPAPTPDALAGSCEAAMQWLLHGHCLANRAYYAARGLEDCASKCATVRYLEAEERRCSLRQVLVACP
jgi:hypothetical protein